MDIKGSNAVPFLGEKPRPSEVTCPRSLSRTPLQSLHSIRLWNCQSRLAAVLIVKGSPFIVVTSVWETDKADRRSRVVHLGRGAGLVLSVASSHVCLRSN